MQPSLTLHGVAWQRIASFVAGLGMMAASALMLMPILALFFAAQRYFVQGLVASGLKG